MVISGVNTVTYNGDGITTAWPYTFPVTDDSEIRVQLNNADGTAVLIESDYYVDLVNSTVYYPGYAPGAEPPEADQPPKVQEGQTITVYREIPITQEADLGDKWPFEVIEKGLDKLTMIAQQIDSGTKRLLNDSLAAMFQLAGIVTDSDKLQHITDQYNAIDENAASAAESADDAAGYAELAKDWATKTDGTVDGEEYSAKKYAGDSAASATNAATSATQADTLYNALIAQGGHPFQAATVADMTDTTKIYVYTGSETGYNNGDWYYYNGSAWVSGGVYNAVAFTTDPTLTISGAAADAQATGDKFADIDDKMFFLTPYNLLDEEHLEDGFITANGTTGGVGENTYRHYVIPVKPNDIISFWSVYAGGTVNSSNMRFICAYKDGVAQTSKGSDTATHTYTVPSDIDSVSISFGISLLAYRLMVVYGSDKPEHYEKYFKPHYIASSEFLPEYVAGGTGYYRQTSAGGSDGVNLKAPKMNLAKNVVIAFTSVVDGSNFTSINIGQGSSSNAYDTFITISTTDIVYNINGNTLSYAHGLTIDKYLNVTITGNDNTKAKILIESNGASYTRTLGFYGFSDAVYYAYTTDTGFNDCVFTVSCRDLIDARNFVFGDSYVAIIEAVQKWTHWAVADGYGDKFLLNAFPGESGTQALGALANVLLIGKPKFLVWAVGMNDGADTDINTPNATWLSNINKMLAICKHYDIVPILVTIPTVPVILNEGKNKWIRESNYRYIDFAKAVGADLNGLWYADMLSNDNVHPTELGAKALWHRVLCDFPEITM